MTRCATVAVAGRGPSSIAEGVGNQMDFSKLDQNEKMAVYGSIAVFIAGLVSNWGGLLFLSILAAIGMVIVVFLPQFSPTTSLPGSKGTLMATLGFVAAGGALLTMLQWIGFLSAFGFNGIMFLVAVVGALVMAWAGWQELQREGGKWRFGTSSPSTAGTTPAGDDAPPPQHAHTDEAAAHEAPASHAQGPAGEAPREGRAPDA